MRLRTVEVYDPGLNAWSFTEPLRSTSGEVSAALVKGVVTVLETSGKLEAVSMRAINVFNLP